MDLKLHKQFCILATVGHVAVHFMSTETHVLHISLLWGPLLEWMLTEIIMNASLLIWFLVLWSETNFLQIGILCVLHQKACRKASFTMCIKSKSMLDAYNANVYKIEKHIIRISCQSVLNRKACYTPITQFVLNRKACYTPITQCVLNRKACYTPVLSMCIKSKSMLYNLGSNVYNIEKHFIQPNFGKVFTL